MNEVVQAASKVPLTNKEAQSQKAQKPELLHSTESAVKKILFLQRTIGNQAVESLIRSGALHSKLKIGQQAQSESEGIPIVRSFMEPRFNTEFGEGVLQRQKTPPTPQASFLRVGIIPVREFIRHVETVERAYPTKSAQEILTMIRSLYYGSSAGSPGFDRLIPDAPNTGAVEMCADSEGSRCEEPVGTCICVYAQGLAMEVGQLRSAVSRLRQHANENEIADNPSPYIEVGTNLIDVGHLLVGVDAILHPRTEDPFRSHGLTSAPGPATWEGDVGAGMVYLAEHRTNGRKSADVNGNPSPTVQSYYRNSAPMSDILGDVDAFGMASMVGPQTLSAAMRRYYVSESGGTARYQYNRWAGFCAAVGLTYTQSGSTITWTPAAQQLVISRITAFSNLFQGRTSPLRAMTLGIPLQAWPEAGNFADLFLADVKSGLEQESASH